MVAYRSPGRSEEDRTQAREALAAAVSTAKGAIERLHGTQVPELRHLMGKLIVQSTLAEGDRKDPAMLR
jgi:hypothetical protein